MTRVFSVCFVLLYVGCTSSSDSDDLLNGTVWTPKLDLVADVQGVEVEEELAEPTSFWPM